MKTLKEAYKDYFDIGATVNVGSYKSFGNLIAEQFDSITCENEMKYGFVCNTKDEYDFSRADELYNFALDNGLKIRGHNFVWHQCTPVDHLDTFSPEKLWERIKEHIKLVSDRYQKVSCWDVINEAADDKNGLFLRDTVWHRKFGDDYYMKIYALARELVPENIQLVYNDYNEYIPEKREKMLRIVNDLKAEGLIDAVGFQSHITIPKYFSLDEYKRTFEEFSKTGLRIHITELDIALPPINTKKTFSDVTAEEREAWAKLYGNVFAVFREYAELIDSVTFWGVSDDTSWLNNAFDGHGRDALLFDRDHQPNEAYFRVTEF